MTRFNRIAALVCAASSLVGSPNVVIAQSLPQPDGFETLEITAPADVRPYDFAILGVKPGMAIADALALIEDHLGKELVPVEGTLQVTSPDGKMLRTQLRVGYVTPGIDFHLRNQSNEPYDSIEIDVSTQAIGSVVTAIRREVRMSTTDGPDAAALIAQLEELYGPPSDLPSGSLGRKWRWALDQDHAPIPMPESYNQLADEACAFGLPDDGRYNYRLNPELGEERNCGMSYTAEHLTNGAATITMSFRMIDYSLMVQDHEAATPQIDKALEVETQPSDMKL